MSEPEKKPSDEKVKRLRERTLDLVADATVHVQRIDGIAKKLGLTPDLVDGVGDYLYEAAVAQLEVASKILERSQVIVDRLFDLGAQRLESGRFCRIDATAGNHARFDFTVRNPSTHAATVGVDVEVVGTPTVRIGQPHLPAHRDTAVEIQIPTAAGDAGKVIPMLVKVHLEYERARKCEVASHDVEIWVRE